MNKKYLPLRLIPYKFKLPFLITLGICILFLILGITKVIDLNKDIFVAVLMLILQLLTVTENKFEDELTVKIRLQAFFLGLFTVTTMFVFDKLIIGLNISSFGLEHIRKPTFLLLNIYLCYFVFLFIYKRLNNNE